MLFQVSYSFNNCTLRHCLKVLLCKYGYWRGNFGVLCNQNLIYGNRCMLLRRSLRNFDEFYYNERITVFEIVFSCLVGLFLEKPVDWLNYWNFIKSRQRRYQSFIEFQINYFSRCLLSEQRISSSCLTRHVCQIFTLISLRSLWLYLLWPLHITHWSETAKTDLRHFWSTFCSRW